MNPVATQQVALDNALNDDEEEEYVHTPDNYKFIDDDEEEYEELYKDVNVRLKDAEHEQEGKGDAEMTDASHEDVSQEKSYEQVEDDAYVTLTAAPVTQKTEGPMQSSSVSSDFANQFLNLDNAPPVYNEVVSMMNVKRKAQDEKKRYIDLINKSVKEIIKDEVNTQLLQILPKEISDFATPMIQSTNTESLENVVLAKSSSQPQSTYEAAASLTEFELKKILFDKMQKSQSYRGAQQHKELYDGLVKSYKLNKDLFESYGKTYSIKRDREYKDKDEDPPAGSDQGLKKRKTSKDTKPLKGSKSKESKSSSSKVTKSQPKSSGKFAQAEELVFETVDTEMPQNQGSDLATDDQPNVDAASKHD
ncbi:hypothetical protein Tco_0140098 [Tanacetum coccineum]